MPLLMHAVRQDVAFEDCVSLEHVGAAFSMAARKLATLRGHVTDEARALRQSAHYFARADAARAACLQSTLLPVAVTDIQQPPWCASATY